MPKKLLKIDDFSGGTNGYADPQNIEDNELAQCSGFKAEKGEVIAIVDMRAAYTLGTDDDDATENIDIEAGYGLFTFSHDYDKDGDLAATNYFVILSRISGSSQNHFNVYDDVDHTWLNDEINLGASASTNSMGSIKPCFFFVDGTLRISPGNFASVASGSTVGALTANTPYMYGDIVVAAESDGSKHAIGDTVEINGLEHVKVLNATFARNMHGTMEGATSGTPNGYVRPDTRWRGLIKRSLFQGLTTIGTTTQWYTTYMHPRPPIRGTSPMNTNAVDHNNDSIPFKAIINMDTDLTSLPNYPPTVTIGLYDGTLNSAATWSGTYGFWVSALYDETKQESQPHIALSGQSLIIGFQLAAWVCVQYSDDGSNYDLNLRCTGARVYYEDQIDEPGVLYQLLEIDFEKGCKKAESDKFSPWVQHLTANQGAACPSTTAGTATNRTGANAFIFENPSKIFTYEINNGYPADTNTHARFKTAVVANRRTYVGNVYHGGKAYGDRMLKSPPNKFDLLPETNFIDVAVGDGDEIIKLEAFADRLLQFKKRTLYIINIGGDYEFLESQHANMGVENPSQTCMTEFGVAWVNKFGVYIYDGKGVTELSRGKLKVVDTTDRARALNIIESNIPLIGYHSLNKWIVIHLVSDVGTAFDAQAWIYDFKNGSWTWSQTFTADADYKTNMINTHNNELVYMAGTNSSDQPDFFQLQTVNTNSYDPAATKLFLLTKDFTLDVPSVKKNIYSVYVTYSAGGDTNLEADLIYRHSTGETTVAMQEASGSTYYDDSVGFKTTTSKKVTVELVPSSAVRNANSFQFKISNPDGTHDISDNFRLYSISFRYRTKGVH